MSQLQYKKGYKYRLTSEFKQYLGATFPDIPYEIETPYVWLGEDKSLILKSGYTCDGPSGPTVDTKSFMRGAFVHDALYQLIRLGYLDKNTTRQAIDEVLYRLCREDGMLWIRAIYVYYAVRVFGNPYAKRRDAKPRLATPPHASDN